MPWHARLDLQYTRDGVRTIAHDRHQGPLRVLQRLYPEGPAVCHHVLVHPPGGLVGGDRLDVELRLGTDCHALLTTPGAARFYRSTGEAAEQHLRARLACGARLEWLPLETLAYSGCVGVNRQRFELAPGAETIAWDVLALGLPASEQPFGRGRVTQSVELDGAWLERGAIDAADTRLLDSPLGLAGRRVLATLWFGSGSAITASRRDALLDAARVCTRHDPHLADLAGATAPNERVVVLRALGDRVEPVMRLLGRVWAEWRRVAWGLPAAPPRVWRT